MTRLRMRVSNALLEGAIERTLDRQVLERNLARCAPDSYGYSSAQRAVRQAEQFERILMWIGWRLQPRLHDADLP